MPIDYKEYHPKWTLIVRLILKRDNNRCKFCGLDNKRVIIRLNRGPKPYRNLCGTEWGWFHDYRRMGFSYQRSMRNVGATIIVLTIAHLDGNKDNNRFINLAALCQKCHLHHDLGHHIMNRKYGRHHDRKHQLKLF